MIEDYWMNCWTSPSRTQVPDTQHCSFFHCCRTRNQPPGLTWPCSDHAHDRMDCRHISSQDVLDSLRVGVVNRQKSDFEWVDCRPSQLLCLS